LVRASAALDQEIVKVANALVNKVAARFVMVMVEPEASNAPKRDRG
jgi:hypothetical protein